MNYQFINIYLYIFMAIGIRYPQKQLKWKLENGKSEILSQVDCRFKRCRGLLKGGPESGRLL